MTQATPKTIGAWVAERPSRSRIFEKAGIDYCCGGNRSLEAAAREAGCDLATLRAELDAHPAEASDRDWREASLPALVEHILGAHHDWLREHMPRISELAAKTAGVHGGHAPQLRNLQEVYASLRGEMEPHLLKEEQVLFPAALNWVETGELSLGCHAAADLEGPLSVMESDHEAVGGLLESIVELTEGFTPPPSACNTWRALYDALRELDANTRTHIHLENEVLHPKIRGLVDMPQRPPSTPPATACCM